MATFTSYSRKGWKKIKYTRQDGKDHYFYAHPKNTAKENNDHKTSIEGVYIQREVSKAVSGGKEHITGEGIVAQKILAEDPRITSLRESKGWEGYSVGELVKRLEARRKKEKREKERKEYYSNK